MKDSAEEMSRKVSATDKSKLDDYLTSVREVEKRVEGMRKKQEIRPRRRPAAKRPYWRWSGPRTVCLRIYATTRS